MFKRLLKVLAWIAGCLFLLALATLTTVDWSAYQEQDYYEQTMDALEGLEYSGGEGSLLRAGWATVNATPKEPQDLVGYKPRGEYEFVQDSSHIKALVVDNGQYTLAILSYELLIIHPQLAQRVEQKIYETHPIDKVYFTATHTHSGMGGYMPGLIGKIAFGGYDKEVVSMLEEKTLLAIQHALATADTVQVHYQKTAAEEFVENRFIAEDPVDPYFRQLVFTKTDGEIGTFITYTAHATCLSSKFMGLSGDYPNYLADYLEEDNVDFALFAAGTVGSHRAVAPGNDIDAVQQYAKSLDSLLTTSEAMAISIERPLMKFATLPLYLRDAHYRISDNIRLRPWLFDIAFGDTNAHFDIVRIGNVLMISSSGEISGVFYEKWEKAAEAKGLHLIITTFNGGYIGYITPDQYYNHRYHEVRDMNWFGPYNGAYFDEIITKIIQQSPED